jgi:penicillin amidase
VDWLDGYRQARIVEALAARSDWTVADSMALQMDQLSLLWQELRETVLALATGTEEARLGQELLAAWDGVVGANSVPAAVYELWLAEMTRRIVECKAPKAVDWAMGKSTVVLIANSAISLRRLAHVSRLIREQPPGWFPRGWQSEMAEALAQAVRTLRAEHGNRVEGWAWGRVRPLTLEHPLGARPPLDKVFNLGPFAWGGDACTVAQSAVVLADPTANSFFVASLRMAVDVGAWEESRYILPSGQSGNPLSPHYADQFPLWQRGEGIPIAWSAESVQQATHTVLRLVPRTSVRTEAGP